MMQAEKLYHWDINRWVASFNANSYNIEAIVGRRNAESRSFAYEDMAEILLCELRSGHSPTYAQYGNAAVANDATHAAVRRAKMEGFDAEILPGISSLDCLFCDLPFEVTKPGCQIATAVRYIACPQAFSRSLPLILLMGAYTDSKTEKPGGIEQLAEVLEYLYGRFHKIIIYQASMPPHEQIVREIPLYRLTQITLGTAYTLFIPESPFYAVAWEQVAQYRRDTRRLVKEIQEKLRAELSLSDADVGLASLGPKVGNSEPEALPPVTQPYRITYNGQSTETNR
jgi:hypothetical protein